MILRDSRIGIYQLKAEPTNREVGVNNFTFRLRIIECSGSLPNTSDYKAVRVKIAAEPEIKRYTSLHLAIATCEAIATLADRCLQHQNVTGARRAFVGSGAKSAHSAALA